MNKDRSTDMYVQPLPHGIRRCMDRQPRPRDGDNLGLWLDKYIPLDPEKFELKGNQREQLLNRLFVARKLGRPVPWHSKAASDAIVRQRESCQLLYGKDSYCEVRAHVHGRLLIDYARLSTIESSLSFHATLGVPRIPGSALKGLLRSAMREEVAPEKLAELFGAPDLENHTAEHTRGRVVLHDALPDGAFSLDLDVLTPHFGDYYGDKTGKVPPADWLSPSPTTFLTVVDTTFVCFIGLLPKREDPASASTKDPGIVGVKKKPPPKPENPASTNIKDPPSIILKEIREALKVALREDGVGAKRSAGYGRLKLKD